MTRWQRSCTGWQENRPLLPPGHFAVHGCATSSQFYKEITWLAAQGISTGWTEGGDGSKTFRPVNAVNRDAMAAFMYRYNAKFNAG